MSPDGRSVYVAGRFDNAIARFNRDPATGALTPAGCIADVGDAAGCGVTQEGLQGATSVTVSPDGESVYVTGIVDAAIARFDRDTTTGALTPAGCIADVGTGICATEAEGLLSATSVAVSPDGKSVYVASQNDDAVVRFDRDATSGALTPAGCIADVGATAGCGVFQQGLEIVRSISVSPDGRSVYTAAVGDDAVARLDRDASGAITPAGCIADVGDAAGCGVTQQGLDQATEITTSLDGRSVYVASEVDDAVVRFDRASANGLLTPVGCIADSGTATCGVASTQEGLDSAGGVAVSPDGRSVYASGPTDQAVVVLERIPDASNHSLIRIPGSPFGLPADPSPSTITVSGLDTKISDVGVTLEGLTHSFPEDLDVLLQGPGGQRVLLLSDAGGGNPGVSDIDLTFDDDAAQQVPVFPASPASGSYRPTNVAPADSFATPYCNPGPDDASPQASCLTQTFNGTDPNGTWSLFIVDDTTSDEGQLARGWSLDIETDVAPPETTIDSGPSGTITFTSTSFGFSSSEAGSTFECSVDGGAFAPCTSPAPLGELADGPHTFAVRATDGLGNVDATPATRGFTVNTPDAPPADAKLDGSATAVKKQKQKGKKIQIAVNITAGEPLKATASGMVKLDKGKFALRALTAALPAGPAALKLKPAKRKDAKQISKALAGGKKAKASLAVELKDVAGNSAAQNLRVKLTK